MRETGNALAEIVAFILARAEINGSPRVTSLETTVGILKPRDQLQRIFQNRASEATNKNQLNELQNALRSKLLEAPSVPGRRGRKAPWRPACESADAANPLVQPPSPEVYKKQRKQDREKFLEMIARYERFRSETGMDKIGWGDPYDRELRQWASRIRTRFHRGLLPDWKIEILKRTRLLEPISSTSPSQPSSITWIWNRRLMELKDFREHHGHCRVSRSNTDNKTLFNWVWTQRALQRQGRLNAEKIKQLEQLGFDWEPGKKHPR